MAKQQPRHKTAVVTRKGGKDGSLLERTVPAHTVDYWRSEGWTVKDEPTADSTSDSTADAPAATDPPAPATTSKARTDKKGA